MASQNINLLQTKTTLQPILGTIEQYVKIGSMIVLSVLFSGGILVGIVFFVFGQKRDTMKVEKEQLLSQVKNDVAKESLLVMIRSRIAAIDKIMAKQISYAPFIDTTMKVIQSYPLSSFSLGVKNSVAIMVKVASIEEAINVLATIMEMEQKKEIGDPILQSFSIEDEKIQIGLSYTVIL